jgi:hypothetical protein
MPNQGNLGLKIGSAILGGLNTFASLRPPDAGGGGSSPSFSGSPLATTSPLSIGGNFSGSYSSGVGVGLGLQPIT